MRRSSILLFVAALSAAGCGLPRSVAVGQTARPLAPGGAEAGTALGGAYLRLQQREAGPGNPDANTLTAFDVPAAEGNFLYGVSEDLGLNLHLSPAGIQPGAKITLLRGQGLDFAILPSIAVGYRTQDVDGRQSVFSLMAGLKAIGSTASGIYGALGYDFQRLAHDEDGPGEEVDTFHYLSAAFGIDLGSGAIRVRPELAVAYAPWVSFESSVATTDESALVVFPNVSVVMTTP